MLSRSGVLPFVNIMTILSSSEGVGLGNMVVDCTNTPSNPMLKIERNTLDNSSPTQITLNETGNDSIGCNVSLSM